MTNTLTPCIHVGHCYPPVVGPRKAPTPATMPLGRRTRNFKGLLLNDTSLPETPPIEERVAPFARYVRSDDRSAGRSGSMPRKGMSSLVSSSRSGSQPPSLQSPDVFASDDIEKRMGGLDLTNAIERTQLDLSNNNLEFLSDLGAGNGGTVTKVKHKPTGILMAKKVVFIDTKPETRKQILRELQILHECHSEYIVGFYGAYLSDVNIYMCMEYMDVGSLDSIYSKHGPIDVAVCGKIVVTVIHGLSYLYESFRIIHRDVKPSNILVNRRCQIKLCDFGVSGELINSIADTFVGTSTYMSVRDPH